MRVYSAGWVLAAALVLAALGEPASAQSVAGVGRFEGQGDIGVASTPGSASFDAASGVYTLSSAGANTWYHVDGFHYLWTKAAGDLAITAKIAFPAAQYAHEPNPHRKGVLMFRQTLDPGAVYAGAGQHGSGMTALQYRRARGANTQDIELNIDAPSMVRIEKRGDLFTLWLSTAGEPLHQVGASIKLHLQAPYYVGLGALSHDVTTSDRVQFSQVSLQPLDPAPATGPLALNSTLQTLQTDDQFRRATIIRSAPGYMQSANWAPDGKSIYVYEDGHIVAIRLTPAGGAAPQPLDMGGLVGCSGNFGLSPGGKWLAVSCAAVKGALHQVYLLPAQGGGAPRPVTIGPVASYFHAWSPDSQTIAFTRGSASKADIFTIPAQGGPERRLTQDTVDDGPDFTPDGKFIYFDSARSGSLQIWRMKPDGSAAEQITDDDYLNTSPHVSPDGKSVAFLSQPAAGGEGRGDAVLRIISSDNGLIRTLTDFQGDRGSFSMYGWGDANHLAFVSYEMRPAQ